MWNQYRGGRTFLERFFSVNPRGRNFDSLYIKHGKMTEIIEKIKINFSPRSGAQFIFGLFMGLPVVLVYFYIGLFL